MPIGRVAGPMLLSELDRQGIDLAFTTSNQPLVGLDFTRFIMAIRGGTQIGQFVLDVNGNAAIGNVILERGGVITTQGVDRHLYLQANTAANVYVTNANVISGRVDGTVIGGLNPVDGTFTYLNANTLATLRTANVQTIRANAIPFTAANGQILVDNTTFKFFSANNRLVVANLSVTEEQTFTTLDTANIIVRGANPTSITYIASNNWVVTSTNLTYYAGNNLVRAGNVRLDDTRTDSVLFVDSTENNKLKGTSYLTYDGINLRAYGITRLGDVTAFNNSIGTAVAIQDLILDPDGSGVISVANHNIRNLATPLQPSDAATKSYVDGLITISTAATNSIFAGDSRVQVLDDNLFTANIVFYVQGAEQGRVESGLVTLQDIEFEDATIKTQAGPLILRPYNNDRIQFYTTQAVTLPVGDNTTRPVPGLEYTGDLRFNSSAGTIEWYNGSGWATPATNTWISQTITPDGTSATFTLDYPATTNSVLVNFNGVIQRPGWTYTVSTDQITFSTVPLTTDIIEIRLLGSTVQQATNPIVADRAYDTVGTSSTAVDTFSISLYRGAKYTYVAKTLTGNNYEIGDVKVIHDGVNAYLSSTFTSKTGTTMLTWTSSIDIYGILTLSAQGTHTDAKVKYHVTYLTEPI